MYVCMYVCMYVYISKEQKTENEINKQQAEQATTNGAQRKK